MNYEEVKKRLDFFLRGGETKRYHTVMTICEQTVAAHSYGVAWLCWMLKGGFPSAELLMAALSHDVAEHKLGDMPGDAKRAMNLRALFDEHESGMLHQHAMHYPLHEEDRRVLKLADAMEGMLFCARELARGNRDIEYVWKNFSRYVQALQPQPGIELNLYDALLARWRALWLPATADSL